MIKQPAYLKKGDKVAIVCPAKKLPRSIEDAILVLEDWGLEVVVGETLTAVYHQFAGDDALRTKDLQTFLDDTSIKAIIAGRGGYGTLRIIDDLDFTAFAANPKWIVGFSDITVLLSHVFAKCEVQSIHAQMPYTFRNSTKGALLSLKKALFGGELVYEYESKSSVKNREGVAEGILIGGNLTLLVMLQGSASEMDYSDKILFLEDVGEHEYAIDRMIRMLKRSGKLEKLKGLIVGAFNEASIEDIPFGSSPEQVIWESVKEYDYPVCFNFPVGHIEDNRAMVLGRYTSIHSEKGFTSIKF
ncbi:muramoyltetrapeptide carboxypeptidase [Pedobacter sp. UYP24]